ncbi:hypothetical protein ABIB90_003654 [Bradyrhizobium sp. JR4.1]|uniref:hypothetical protein n=1 Tax=unclassified Bradyrhizobium TaxID=2631580 RepID=UPI0033939EAE
MRPLSLAFLAVFPLISIPAAAQQTGATSQAGVDQKVQTEADKGIKTAIPASLAMLPIRTSLARLLTR